LTSRSHIHADPSTGEWLHDPLSRSLIQHTETFDPTTGQWSQATPFIYADGGTHPPLLLRDIPEQNYLNKDIRAAGLALMSIALLIVTTATLWIAYNRRHNVIIAAQPVFLYTICFGSAILAFDIWLISHDESNGWDTDMLSKVCAASTWIDSTGHMLIYLAIFTKVRRKQLIDKLEDAGNQQPFLNLNLLFVSFLVSYGELIGVSATKLVTSNCGICCGLQGS
jgi:hypothetical protein